MRNRLNNKIIKIAMLPTEGFGEESELNNALMVLREVVGVRGANLFFRNSAVRIYYDSKYTDLEKIYAVLLPLKDKFQDQAIHQEASVGSIVGR